MTRAAKDFLVLALVVLLTLSASAAWAQLSTAELNGRVTDSSGAVLPGVTVTATQTATGLVRTAVTDEQRLLPDLEPADRAVPAGSRAAGIPHLRADRARAAGRRHADDQRRPRARLARGDGHGRSRRAARRRPQRRHQRGRRERADRRAAAPGPAGHRPARAVGRGGADGRGEQPRHRRAA